MKAPPLAYARAESLAHLFALWHQAGDGAVPIAGGQSLLATLAFRLSQPSALLDIGRLPELAGISETPEAIRIGALTTHTMLGADPLVARHAKLLAQAVPLIAHAAIRNRGTLGGSLAYADPAAELPACMVALDATIHIVGEAGERTVAARDFFSGLYATALAPRELIAAVSVPKAPSRLAGIEEIARRAGDYAIAGLALTAARSDTALSDVRAVFFGVGVAPVVAPAAARALESDGIAAAQAALARDLNPPTDLHGGPAVRMQLCRVLLARLVARLSDAPEAIAA
jgi:carbon-monoxide dehydrogenase medium subunit